MLAFVSNAKVLFFSMQITKIMCLFDTTDQLEIKKYSISFKANAKKKVF